MPSRRATHAEAVYIARAMNQHIETVWQILQSLPLAPIADLEQAVRTALVSGSESPEGHARG